MNLLIDLGNSRLKWGTATLPENITTGRSIDNTKISTLSLITLWQGLARPDRVAIANVSSSRLLEYIVQSVNELWPGISVYMAESKLNAGGVTSAYRQPEKLGVDRWLGMIAAYRKYRKAFCLAGCGTAITIDVVDNGGKHWGGLIAPGLKLMQQALANGTENLGQIEDNYPVGLANNTGAAIYNGTVYAACGLIKRVLDEQPPGLELILTGGDAAVIADNLLHAVRIEPDLVLQGLVLTLAES